MQFIQRYACDATTGAVIRAASVAVRVVSSGALAALYTSTGATLANPLTADGDGLYGFAAANGDYDVVVGSQDPVRTILFDPADSAGLSQVVSTPQLYGAIGDGASHPASTKYASLAALQAVYAFATDLSQELDFLGWKAALNAGGAVFSAPLHYVMCNANPASQQPLTIVAGQSWVQAFGAKYDFSAMTAQQPSTHYVPNYNFASSADWTNTTATHTDAVFGSGSGAYTDPSAYTGTGDHTHFCQFGQAITLQPGRYRASCTFTATEGASFSNGNPNPPFAGIQFFEDAVGAGSNPFGGSAAGSGLGGVFQGAVTQTIHFDFIVSAAATAYLTFSGGGYANFSVSAFDVQDWYYNCAAFLTRDGAAEHYPIYQPIEGVEWIGPTNKAGARIDNLGVTCLRWKSFTNQDGNLATVANSSVHGFDTGVSFEDGAYLVPIYGLELQDNGVCYSFPIGSVNAGENFRLFGGTIGGSAVGIDNPGGCEMTLFGTALDYNTQAIRANAGRIELHGVHAEMFNPVTAGLPLFECVAGGAIDWYGGMFLGAGDTSAHPEPPVALRTALSHMRLHGTEIYNLSCDTGYACSGPGVLSAPGGWRNRGNPNIGPLMLSDAPIMDVLNGAGSFQPSPDGLYGLDPSGIYLPGGGWSYTPAYSVPSDPGYRPASAQTDRWSSTYFNLSTSIDHAPAGETNSLKIVKSDGQQGVAGSYYETQWLVPVKSGQNAWVSFEWLAPNNVGSGSQPLYARLFWRQVLYQDGFGRPVYGRSSQYAGEFDISIPLAGSASWTQWAHNTCYQVDTADPAQEVSGGAPPWATHLAIVLDYEALPDITLYLGKVRAQVL